MTRDGGGDVGGANQYAWAGRGCRRGCGRGQRDADVKMAATAGVLHCKRRAANTDKCGGGRSRVLIGVVGFGAKLAHPAQARGPPLPPLRRRVQLARSIPRRQRVSYVGCSMLKSRLSFSQQPIDS